MFGSADLNVADREARRILARAKRAGQAAEADEKVAGFLNGSGPEMTLDELREAHQALDRAVAAGVTSADRG